MTSQGGESDKVCDAGLELSHEKDGDLAAERELGVVEVERVREEEKVAQLVWYPHTPPMMQ
eukprot:746386-Hanusia_phi.AAC.3